MADSLELHENWTLSHAGGGDTPITVDRLPATVPGCVHTDLLGHALIPDPYLDANEDQVQWIGYADWRYDTTFEATANDHDRADLVFEGLDTVAEVQLNGTVIGSTENQHRSFRFPVQDLLHSDGNSLSVLFTSAINHAAERRDAAGDLPHNYPLPSNFIRKMASNFGWDWGPTLVTAGIWKPVRLHRWSTSRLDQVRPEITVAGTDGVARVHIDIERAGADVPVTVDITIHDVTTTTTLDRGVTSATVDVRVPDVELWWPRGYGAQPLYDLDVRLSDLSGAQLDVWSRRVGFRTVTLNTTPDEVGAQFTFEINGTPIAVKGSNWIPDDCFPVRVTEARYRERLTQAVESNQNLMRVWGGGLYESDIFYGICDELGLMVWQDFLFACASYPEEEPLRTEVEAEAREAIVRLMPHPSLIVWNGNNENIWGWFDWGWQEPVGDRTWGLGYYLDLLPALVAELDPTRPYWAGSPYAGTMDLHPNVDTHGPKHVWDVWNTEDWTVYRNYRPRFVSEFGYQAPPTYATVRESISDQPLRSDSPFMLHHQKANDGNGKLTRGLAHHFPDPAGFDDWHYLTQINQARALTTGIEHYRSLWPHCSGVVMWQINDCWPVTSWAAVDGYGREKPLFHALRRAYAPRMLTFQPDADSIVLVAGNDTDQPWDDTVTVTLWEHDGARETESLVLHVEPRTTTHVNLPDTVTTPSNLAASVVSARSQDAGAEWFFVEDRDFEYSAADLEVAVRQDGGTADIIVHARKVIRDLLLQVDRIAPNARVDSALVTLLPGETHTFHVRNLPRPIEAVEVVRPVLMSVNDAVRAALAGTPA